MSTRRQDQLSAWQHLAASPSAFRDSLIVEAGGQPVRFGEVMDPWQREDFAACDAGWLAAVGRPADGPVVSRAYLERPRGHSKTTDEAVSIVWALAFAPRLVRGYAAAADRDQGKLIRDAIDKLIRLNPWLAKILEIQNYRVLNIATGHQGYGSDLQILSSDVGSSYGLLPDFIVCDEVTHWTGDGSLWHSLISSAAKRSTCMVVVISNAGTNQGDSWQWSAREKDARTSDGWHFRSLDGPQASWITAAILEEQRLMLPGSVYARLWENQWVTGGDAIDGSDVESAVTLPGPLRYAQRGLQFVGGLDLGVKSDHSAFVALGADASTQRVRLAECKAWKPARGGEVDLQAVEDHVADAHQRYRFREVRFDPHQCQLMAQRLRRRGVPMVELPFVGKNLNAMATAVLESFRSRRVDLYRDPDLMRDFARLTINQKSFGFKLEAARDAKQGHADRAIAFAIALPAAIELAGRVSQHIGVPFAIRGSLSYTPKASGESTATNGLGWSNATTVEEFYKQHRLSPPGTIMPVYLPSGGRSLPPQRRPGR